MKPLVSVIIINWNGLHWLKRCLPTLERVTYKPVEWIIVDNASTDGSVEWVKGNYPKAKVVVNVKNFGFSHANNIGYKEANGDYILFLNNDTEVTQGFVTELVRAFENDPKTGCAQSKILLLDDKSRLDSVGAFFTPTGFLYHYGFRKADDPKYDATTDMYTAKGACMMFAKTALRATETDGWIFDPDYFAYFEETDLCHRVWLAGYRVVYAPASVIYHKMGATSGGMDNAFVQYHSFKNRIRTYLKNCSPGELLTVIPIHAVLIEGLSLYWALRGRFAHAWAVQRAIGWNLRMFCKTMSLRRIIRSRMHQPLPASVMRKPGLGYYVRLAKGDLSYE